MTVLPTPKRTPSDATRRGMVVLPSLPLHSSGCTISGPVVVMIVVTRPTRLRGSRRAPSGMVPSALSSAARICVVTARHRCLGMAVESHHVCRGSPPPTVTTPAI